MSTLFKLTETTFAPDIQCQNEKCGTKYDVRWTTEYADPIIGDHHVNCPKCGQDVHFEVYYQYIQ